MFMSGQSSWSLRSVVSVHSAAHTMRIMMINLRSLRFGEGLRNQVAFAGQNFSLCVPELHQASSYRVAALDLQALAATRYRVTRSVFRLWLHTTTALRGAARKRAERKRTLFFDVDFFLQEKRPQQRQQCKLGIAGLVISFLAFTF